MEKILALGSRVLNCMVVGQLRAGTSVLQTSINMHSKAMCHGDVLHPDLAVRRKLYEDYFGPDPSEDTPGWYVLGGLVSPEQYLTARIFDHPLYQEQVIGATVPYPRLHEHVLWEYCHERCLEGDFCVIHVRRNPIACYVSLMQAEQTGVWSQLINDRTVIESPHPVRLDPRELTTFCRWHAAHEGKIAMLCDDRLEINYLELITNYPKVMEGVFAYLELSPLPGVRPGVRRLKNRSLRDRVLNFEAARREVPSDVRMFFDADDLF